MTFNPQPIHAADPRIWLASASPRRRSLLEQIGLVPVVRASSVPERPDPGEAPVDYTERLARSKGVAVREAFSDAERDAGPHWIVAADTVVVHLGVILEKPASVAEARALVSGLGGATHEVVTGFWVGDVASRASFAGHVRTQVTFRSLDEGAVDRYVQTGEPMDKAGGYGIQGVGAFLVERIEGCYFNVVGLPISAVLAALDDLGALGAFPFAAAGGR